MFTTYAQFDLCEIISKGTEMVAAAWVLKQRRRNRSSPQNLLFYYLTFMAEKYYKKTGIEHTNRGNVLVPHLFCAVLAVLAVFTIVVI